MISSQNDHQAPFLPPYSCANRKCWEMQHSESMNWEFQPSSFVVLSCCILVQVCLLVRTQGCIMKLSVIIPQFCAHVFCWKFRHDIWQQSSFMNNNAVMNNGKKEAQSHMVMRLYFRASAASVWNSELFSVVVRQKMSAWTGGRFSQEGKEVLWLYHQLCICLQLIIWAAWT